MSQVWKPRWVFRVIAGYVEKVVRQLIVCIIFPFKVMESDTSGDRRQYGNVDFDGETRREFHLDEISKLLEVFELRRDDLKTKN